MTKIEWTEATWNPIVGCSILTPGCTNCYAMQMAARIEAMNQEARETERSSGKKRNIATQYDGTTKKVNGKAVWTGKLTMVPDHVLLQPLKRKKPTTYFVNSMGDLFHEDCPDEWIDRVFAVMALCPQHTFQVLTKRAERMRDYFSAGRQAVIAWDTVLDIMKAWYPDWNKEETNGPHRARAISAGTTWPLENVWLGVSTERQKEADERIPLLLQTPAAVRFISAEPLLGAIDITRCGTHYTGSGPLHLWKTTLEGNGGWRKQHGDNPPELDWVIVGGESGNGARPMHPDWARSLRDQCAAAGVPYFFKQWGMWGPDTPDTGAGSDRDPIFEGKGPCAKFENGKWEFSENGFTMPLGGDHEWMYRLGKKAAGRLLDNTTHNAMPVQQDHVISKPVRRVAGE